MLKRLLLALVLSALPFVASADDVAPAPAPTPASAASAVQGSPTGTAAGGSNADGGALQPAATSSLGSATSDSAGLTAPNSNVLQAPSTDTAQLRVLLGSEADGAQTTPDDQSGDEFWPDALAIGGLLLAAIIVVIVRQRQLKTARARFSARD